MGSTMKTRATAALLAAGIAGMATLSGASAQEVVRIGTTPESYPPFTTIDANGAVQGFEADLAAAFCEEMQVKCEWVLQAWDGIIPALTENKFDAIIASMSITEERKQVVDFSAKYYNTPAMFVGAKSADITISPEGLAGKIVGVQVSTVHAAYIEAKYKDIVEIKNYDTQENANLDLIAGRVDLLLADSIALEDSLLKTPDGEDFEVKGEPFTDPLMGDGVGVAVRKEDTALRDKFSAAIKALRDSGKYKEINDKYFTFDVYGG
ncbi:lysine/arginine/ornithine ABC transporter substrate-binding protein [Methylobrevis albus]|uniref:Transporter substrate-binding domain-containing protein n=1 Tax=Methylobrevis albus TaxID=2793297 RepID=A0A931N0J6_9HYPH|nr:lysine/arginine/ornithine ABC transporter substrate-binding protein [Methylobrevis albus]MBH0239274.1 transporter substrate-binding domain-containing protein [Methylobrevis albus]